MGQKSSMGCARSTRSADTYAPEVAEVAVSARLTGSSRSSRGAKATAATAKEEATERRRGEQRKPRVDCWRGDRKPLVRDDEAPGAAPGAPAPAAQRPQSVAAPRRSTGADAPRSGVPATLSVTPQPGTGRGSTPVPARRSSTSVPAPKKDSNPAKRSSKGKGKGEKGLPAKAIDLDEHEKALLNEVLDASPGVSWDAIAGLEEVKRLFWEIVVAPVKNPLLFSGVRSPPRGVLLFGPPGNGKTMLAKAVASECNATFFSISASSLVSKWVGDSEKHMRALFSVAGKMQPSVIFMDEIDSMLTSRSSGEHEAARRLKTEFLVQLDGAGTSESTRILLLGATNRPGELDDAVLRRLPRRILIPLPDGATRGLLVSKELQGTRHSLSTADFTRLASMTDGYSCSDLAALTREAAMGPVRNLRPEALVSATPEGVRAITLADFREAIQKVRPSVSKEVLSEFERWNRAYGSVHGRLLRKESTESTRIGDEPVPLKVLCRASPHKVERLERWGLCLMAAEIELEALKSLLGSKWRSPLCKTVKFDARPTLTQLTAQLKSVTPNLAAMMASSKSFHITSNSKWP
ncbi:unnamed protein product [Cladocopium goreaui]|uniref:microtubule-severing ATPase n=1 Tax=Cladocopium goreaui TaxID=2562237 RepID=A0A9P1CCH4_9DINO|nr:unnamed protein product [Cladocopium goreaui]